MRRAIKARVTAQGVVIPRDFLDGIDEVEIRKDDRQITVVPAPQADPILGLGENPVSCGVTDGSENHDRYLYGSNK